MPYEGSVTRWIGEVKDGDEAAAERLFHRYFEQLVRLCRKKLGVHPRRVTNEEDAAQSAFASLFESMKKGRYPQLHDRGDLWRLLMKIAARKVINQIKHQCQVQKRNPGKVAGPHDPVEIEQVIGDEPTPEYAAMVKEEYGRLLARLDDEASRQIAQLKLEGYTNKEIADMLHRPLRTIERKLARIRATWSEEGFGCE
jgi:RNA polymerase sigma factor (sigma-70 family)